MAAQWECTADEILDLSTGVYPAYLQTRLARWLAVHANLVSRYPDPDGEPAASALARTLGIDRQCLLLASGAQAIIEVLFSAMPWRSIAFTEPNYSEIRHCAERSGVSVRILPAGRPFPSTDAIWVTDPHSLTGAAVDSALDADAGVLDESYATCVQRQRPPRKGWIRVGSLTKCFALPGLRLGYAVAAPEVVQELNRFLPPWPASTLALHWLPEVLGEWEALDQRMSTDRERLLMLLRRTGWKVFEPHASSVLGWPDPLRLPAFERERIVVRRFPEWPELEGAMRLGIPLLEEGWARLEAALCR